MKINSLERHLVEEFFRLNRRIVSEHESFFSQISLDSRDYTGVGFISKLKKCSNLLISSTKDTYQWGKFGAVLNSSIDTGYLFYVENGYLTTIEGYTYTDDWPDEIQDVEVYLIED